MLKNTIGNLIHSLICFSKTIELHLKHTILGTCGPYCAILSCCPWGVQLAVSREALKILRLPLPKLGNHL